MEVVLQPMTSQSIRVTWRVKISLSRWLISQFHIKFKLIDERIKGLLSEVSR